MKRLNKNMTQRFITQDQFNELEATWKALSNLDEPALTAFDHFLYLVLRGKDWTKGFIMPLNPKKVKDTINDLHHPAVHDVLNTIHGIASSRYSNYGGQLKTIVTKDMIKAVAEHLPTYEEVLNKFSLGEEIISYKELVHES